MMFVKLHKVNQADGGKYYLSEIHVNISHITYISENREISHLVKEGKVNLGLNKLAKFSNIFISSAIDGSKTIIVVGDPTVIETKINLSNRQLLRG